jgi:hypothetical protein
MWADMVAAGGHLAGGDIKAMINVEEYSVLDKIGARAGVALAFGKVCPPLHDVDLASQADRLDVTVSFAEGRADANVGRWLKSGEPSTAARHQDKRRSQT